MVSLLYANFRACEYVLWCFQTVTVWALKIANNLTATRVPAGVCLSLLMSAYGVSKGYKIRISIPMMV